MKEVDWIPYLTTRLVDDAASHLRLYRQACAKTRMMQKKIEEAKQKTITDLYKPQTLQNFKTTTEQSSAELKQYQCHSRSPSGSNITAPSSAGHSRNNSSSGTFFCLGKVGLKSKVKYHLMFLTDFQVYPLVQTNPMMVRTKTHISRQTVMRVIHQP